MPSSDHNQERDPSAPKPRPARSVSSGGCGGSCESCGQNSTDADAEPPSPGPFQGWSLAAVAAAYFLVPLGCALAGATLFRTSADAQSLAVLLSLAVGMVATAAAARAWSRRRTKESLDG